MTAIDNELKIMEAEKRKRRAPKRNKNAELLGERSVECKISREMVSVLERGFRYGRRNL